MFVNMANGRRGLVCQYDVACFDGVSGVSFDQKDGVTIMKGYMESGEFSRGRESIRGEGSIVPVGNFEVDMQHQLHIGNLFGGLPPEMRNDTAFMDRIHACLPGWDIPKVSRGLFTGHFGLVSDVLAETFSRLRSQSRSGILQGRVHLGGALSGRDGNAVGKTVSGLLKLLYPGPPPSRYPTTASNGPCASPWSVAAGSRSSRNGSVRPSSAIRSFPTAWGSTASSSLYRRPNCKAKAVDLDELQAIDPALGRTP
jgi:uncharacterized protein (TIGR02688 family)